MAELKGRRGNGRQGGSQQQAEPPVWKKRCWTGASIEVAVWSRMVPDGEDEREVLSVTVRKQYKKGDQWHETAFLNPHEVPVVAALLQDAFAFVTNQQNKE